MCNEPAQFVTCCDQSARLFDDLEPILFDDRIGKDFFGDALELLLGLVPAPAVQIKDKELTLANIFHLRITQPGKGVLDGLTLWIKYGALWHDPNMCLHGREYSIGSLPLAELSEASKRVR
jgi:hypothetical protein